MCVYCEDITNMVFTICPSWREQKGSKKSANLKKNMRQWEWWALSFNYLLKVTSYSETFLGAHCYSQV